MNLFDFASWGVREYIAQGFGLCALIILCVSFMQKEGKALLILQSVASFCWLMNMILIMAPAGIMLNSIGLIRNVLYIFKEKWKWIKHWAMDFLFMIAFILVAVFSYFSGDGWLGLLPSLACIVVTVSLLSTNTLHARLGVCVSSPLWLTYNVFHSNIAGIISESVCLAVAILGIILIDVLKISFRKK